MAALRHTARLRETISLGNARTAQKVDTRDSQSTLNQNSDKLNFLFDTYTDLRTAQEEFENFISEVSDDLLTKVSQLKAMKHNESATWMERSYASVQLIILNQYLHRVNRFKVLSKHSLEDLCKTLKDEAKRISMIAQHINTIGKLKRRLKHMLDVTDRYLGADISAIHALHKDLDEDNDFPNNRFGEKRNGRMQRMSLISCQKSIIEKKKEDSEYQPVKRQRLNSLKSISDHLSVLTKTYTNRR